MLSVLFWASLARAQVYRGRDDFGRMCAVRLSSAIAALVEGEWYDGVPDQGAPPELLSATLHAREDRGTAADFELHRTPGRAAWFRLTLQSATGYAHVCRLERPRSRRLRGRF